MSKWDVDSALQEIFDETEAVNRVRKEIAAKRVEGQIKMSFVMLGALVLAILVSLLTKTSAGFWLALPVALIGGVWVFYTYFGDGLKRYRMLFKVGVIEKFIKHIEPEMNYEPERGIPESVYKESGLFRADPDRYHSEDLIHGMIGDTKLMFSEVHAEERHTSRDADGTTSTRWETTFKGIFVVADFHKEFRSAVSVMPDVAERHFGWFGKKLQKLGRNLQKMESPEFEKMFVVRGVDSVETRYILTPAMQDRLVRLRRRVGGELSVVFRDSHVWLAIPNKDNWFEGDIHRPAGDRTQMAKLMGELRSCFQIVEELDLNTRIWTKE
jgi:hypothetical protein